MFFFKAYSLRKMYTAAYTLARRSFRNSRAPLRSCLRAIPILADVRGHLELSRVLTLPHVTGLSEHWPQLTFKYLRDYLAWDFSRRERLAILTNHYRYLENFVSDDFLIRIFERPQTVWQERKQDYRFAITLSYPKTHGQEGELCLTFEANAVRLYEITFTIAPCRILKAPCEQALLIVHIQGVPEKISLIRESTKLCDDTAPPHLLLAAVAAVAASLQIDMLIGIGNDRQLSRDPRNSVFFFDYDEFWKSFCTVEINRFYLRPIPFQEKPIGEIRRRHRSRAMRRRELRSWIFESTRRSFDALRGVSREREWPFISNSK